MSLFVLGDLHLCFSDPSKTMSIFPGWENYQERIRQNWLDNISPQDTIVLAGDISWGMSLEQALPDFQFINELPGKKIILKGNHDYWWATLNKMQTFFSEQALDSLFLLHNNHYQYESFGICGTRGWVNGTDDNRDAQNEKVLKREVQRLETSILSAVNAGLEPLVFMHYPPIFASNFNYDILSVLYKYEIKKCYYGHIHGRSAHELCVQNTYDGIDFHLISGDYTKFVPIKVL